MDDVAVSTQRFPQCRDLTFEILFRNDDARPYSAPEFLFSDERAVGLQQGQQEIERARAELDGNAVGEQLSLAQQDAETAEFENLAGVCPVRSMSALRKWVSASTRLWMNKRLHDGTSRSSRDRRRVPKAVSGSVGTTKSGPAPLKAKQQVL
jgi:hypothetical protein